MSFSQRLFSRKTLKQLVGYGIVGGAEWALGYAALSELVGHEHIGYLLAFTLVQLPIGFGAFLVRKFAIFDA